jgi:hypothetical protein
MARMMWMNPLVILNARRANNQTTNKTIAMIRSMLSPCRIFLGNALTHPRRIGALRRRRAAHAHFRRQVLRFLTRIHYFDCPACRRAEPLRPSLLLSFLLWPGAFYFTRAILFPGFSLGWAEALVRLRKLDIALARFNIAGDRVGHHSAERSGNGCGVGDLKSRCRPFLRSGGLFHLWVPCLRSSL